MLWLGIVLGFGLWLGLGVFLGLGIGWVESVLGLLLDLAGTSLGSGLGFGLQLKLC